MVTDIEMIVKTMNLNEAFNGVSIGQRKIDTMIRSYGIQNSEIEEKRRL